jgi:uncharacterized protein YjbJ (UPF0337 family)
LEFDMTISNDARWELIAGRWEQLNGEVKKQWGGLTNAEFARIDGDREILCGILQEKFGIARELADRQIDRWVERLKL